MKKFLVSMLSVFILISLTKSVQAYYAEGEKIDWKAEIKAVEVLIEISKKEKAKDQENLKIFLDIDTKLDDAARAVGIMADDGTVLKPESKNQIECFVKQVVLRIKARQTYEEALSTAVFLAATKKKEDATAIIKSASDFKEKCSDYYIFARDKDRDLSDQLDRDYEKYAQRNKDEMSRTNGKLSEAINDLGALLEDARSKLYGSDAK